jgi:aspartate/glutamate racemase|tara:strand:- start:4792 stop:5466 length:675 start_codon:yes stop_codon:yes gene_type:complete
MTEPSQGSLALIHTVTSLVPTFEKLIKLHLPGWHPFNIIDESLLRLTIKENTLSTKTARRVAGYVSSAIDAGADAILVTCSSIGPAIDAYQSFCPVPLVRVDIGMADEAIRRNGRIGILATLKTTLDPTRDLLINRANAINRSASITHRVCTDAFTCLSAGDNATHDAIIREEIIAMSEEVDIIVLAQASMARVLSHKDIRSVEIPILSSPELGVLALKSQLRN